MGSAIQLRPLQMKYRHTGAASDGTNVLLMSTERDGKRTLEGGKRERGKEGRNCREMTTKIKDTIIKCKVNLSIVIIEKVDGFDAFLLLPLIGKIT